MSLDRRLWDEHEERLVQFLLGRLPDADREELENRALAEDGFLDEVLATGDELIQAYLNGSLSGEDRARFETHFLATPLRRERFERLRDLDGAMRNRVPASAVRWWILAAAAAVLVALGLLTLRFGRVPVGDQVAHDAPTPVAPRPSNGETTPVVRLPARPADAVDISVSDVTRSVRIEVPIEDDRHPTFDAFLRTPDGDTVWESTGLVPPGPGLALILIVPAEILAADEYVLRVEGEKLRDAPRHKRVSMTYALRIVRRH